MTKPRFSIIIPTLNRAEFLEKAICSVLDQGYPEKELIVIDGGSSDRTTDMLRKYEPHLAYWVSEPDRGQTHAINKGLGKAKGDIVHWLNSDDYYEHDAFAAIADAYEQGTTHAVAAKSRIIGMEQTWISQTPLGNDFQIFSHARIDQPATFFSKTCIQRLGQLDETLHLCMDLDMWIRFVLLHSTANIRVVDQVVVNFIEHPDSKTVQHRNQMVLERALLLSDLLHDLQQVAADGRYRSFLAQVDDRRRTDIIKGCHDFLLYWYGEFKRRGEDESVRYMAELLKKSKLSLREQWVKWKSDLRSLVPVI